MTLNKEPAKLSLTEKREYYFRLNILCNFKLLLGNVMWENVTKTEIKNKNCFSFRVFFFFVCIFKIFILLSIFVSLCNIAFVAVDVVVHFLLLSTLASLS